MHQYKKEKLNGNRKNRGQNPEPIYTMADAEATLDNVVPILTISLLN